MRGGWPSQKGPTTAPPPLTEKPDLFGVLFRCIQEGALPALEVSRSHRSEVTRHDRIDGGVCCGLATSPLGRSCS